MTGVRAYVAGTGASGSLLLAALVAFVSVTAFVGFEGVPIGGDDAGVETVSLNGPDRSVATAAAAAAAAVGGTPAAVAAVPAAPAAAPGAPGLAGAPATGAADTAPTATPGPVGAPGVGSATQTDVAPVPAATPSANPVDDVVAGVDTTLEDTTGVNPGLGGTTKPVTGAVDQTLQDLTGNSLGGHLDNLLGPGNRAGPGLGLTP